MIHNTVNGSDTQPVNNRDEALRRFGAGESSVAIGADMGLPASTIRRWATEARIKKGEGEAPRETPDVITRRCRNIRCLNRFVPVNDHHFFCSPECRQAPELHSIEDILREEGSLFPTAEPMEMAKRAFGQKNKVLRRLNQAVSLRDYMRFEMEELWAEDPRLRYPEPFTYEVKSTKSARILVVQLSDWQLGKLEQGVGVRVLQENRIPRIIEAIIQIIHRQREAGHPVDLVVISLGGDMIEGCWIYGGQQVSGLDRTDNTHRITRQAYLCANTIADVVQAVANHCDVYVVSVPGNHGRPNGKNDFADPEDNIDTLVAWWARDKCANFPNVRWDIHENWFANFNVYGWNFVSFHGDAWNGPLERIESLLPQWALGQVFGVIPDVVLTHHRHEFAVKSVNGVTVIQNGTIDGGSLWYTKQKGKVSAPEQTILVVAEKRKLEACYPVYF